MGYTEDDLIPLSALQHLVFCERQCALIHIEQAWDENRLTAEGRIMHERAHETGGESRGKVRVERGLPLRSLRLGLIAKADVVEFHFVEEGKWRPFPVEYKRGKPKPDDCDKVQLCGQAMCLEEMLQVAVPAGAIYYGKTHHRLDVEFNEQLRKKTDDAARRAHDLIRSGTTPEALYDKRCERCSLVNFCLPRAAKKRRSVQSYLIEARRPE
ncbi:RecB family exonuclease N [uncultured Desulfobacterium sp.]|uniref:CRISPR-associated exonuclease Cas4 n=1 Tax=uncultured Desulfobacterium sp. TaxID=201089 RepID=A0A445MVP2_9BACT|nr:RecB family exonuclease N [uncultured Desulfobacterium sp.]